MEAHDDDGDFSSIFHYQPAWFLEERHLIQDDRARYHDNLAVRSHTYSARVNGLAEPISGLW